MQDERKWIEIYNDQFTKYDYGQKNEMEPKNKTMGYDHSIRYKSVSTKYTARIEWKLSELSSELTVNAKSLYRFWCTRKWANDWQFSELIWFSVAFYREFQAEINANNPRSDGARIWKTHSHLEPKSTEKKPLYQRNKWNRKYQKQ